MEIRVFTSMFEDGEDQLSNLIENLKQEAKDEEEAKEQAEEEEEVEVERCDELLGRLQEMHLRSTQPIHEEEEEEPHSRKKKRRSKYLAPD